MTDQELHQWVKEVSINDFGKIFKHQAYFNSRLRTTGGRYLLQSHHIEINPLYLEHYGEEEVLGIIRHELVHYHLHLEKKGYRHQDADFKNLLKLVDAPRYCRALPRKNEVKKQRIHLYNCLNCGLHYSRKIRMNTQKYRCGKCSGRLHYYGEKII